MIRAEGVTRVKADLRKFAERIGVEVATIQKKLVFDIFMDIVQATPIDTGRAMNGWNISVGFNLSSLLLRSDPSDFRRDKGQIVSSKRNAALDAGNQINGAQIVYITNMVPYIIYLNEGSSDQAPKSFVETAVRSNVRALRRAAS